MHAAAEVFAQEVLYPALHRMCLHGRDRDQSICWLSPAEQRDPSLAFCAPTSIQAICPWYSQQPLHLLLHKPLLHGGRPAERTACSPPDSLEEEQFLQAWKLQQQIRETMN